MTATLPVSYTSVDLMFSTFPEIGSLSSVNSAGFHHHAGMAESRINAAISRLYSLPFTVTIPLLQTLATDMAIYNVLSTRIALKTDDGEHPWYQRFKAADATLNDIANGNIPLVDSSGGVVTGRGDMAEVYSNTMDYHPTFWEGPIEDQVPDVDKLDDGADDRSDTIGDRLI